MTDVEAPGSTGTQVSSRGRRSREEILDAVVATLLEEGYAATTTMRVQARAGVSRGKLLHHFPSKKDLITAAVERLAAQRLDVDALPEPPAVPPGEQGASAADLRTRLDWAVRQLWQSFFHPNFWAATETWIAARTDPALAAEMVDHEKRVLKRVRQNIRLLFGPVISADPGYDRAIAVVFTSMRGMAVTYTFSGRDPESEPMLDTWVATAAALLDCIPDD
ncbi:TetR/AcrR family transcriptional regulator [Brevibacterium litoralis]|uniref:TetR/AcrR family transcriptional regulator n=1 Tax=Brevibacterium litoralis TaxID=3138935 RepID=UPI0032EB240F